MRLISGLGYPAFHSVGRARYVFANPRYGIAAEQRNEQNSQNNKKKHSFDHDSYIPKANPFNQFEIILAFCLIRAMFFAKMLLLQAQKTQRSHHCK
ncbi:MAG: hypothetical protein JXN61_13985 [Sedimentisphaerales bacterium]|nr:hypothetical protein [Sedimentisphaerales bacterium]